MQNREYLAFITKFALTSTMHPNHQCNEDLNKNLHSSGMSPYEEMKEMVTASPPRKGAAKNLLTRTARSVFSVLNRVHSDATDDDYSTGNSKDAYTYEYAAPVFAVCCASDDDATEDSHSVDSAVAAVDSLDAIEDMSEDSTAVDAITATTDNDSMGIESTYQTVGIAADEMESYQGDGHSPRNFEHEVKGDESWSRALWTAARDDFDFIMEDLETSVSIARLRVASENHKEILEPNKYLSLCLDKAKMIGHKHQDVIVMMKSWRSIPDEEEFDTLEEMRQPWKTAGASFFEKQSGKALRI